MKQSKAKNIHSTSVIGAVYWGHCRLKLSRFPFWTCPSWLVLLWHWAKCFGRVHIHSSPQSNLRKAKPGLWWNHGKRHLSKHTWWLVLNKVNRTAFRYSDIKKQVIMSISMSIIRRGHACDLEWWYQTSIPEEYFGYVCFAPWFKYIIWNHNNFYIYDTYYDE